MPSVVWGADVAAVYDATSAHMYAPDVLDPAVDALVGLAGGGRVLELASGTGRLALALHERGVEVHGIELSEHMVAEMRRKPGGSDVAVTVGDMCTVRAAGMADGSFRLVFLAWNSIMNVTTQDEQVAVFHNAAAHLEPGGAFVVEVLVPQVRRLPAGERARVFALADDHVGIETFDDPVTQVSWSHHWRSVDGRLVRHAAPYRYVWPAELDLMARIAGMRLRARWSGWEGRPFQPDGAEQVVVYERPARSLPAR